MTSSVNQLVRSLFGKSSLEDCDVEELKIFTRHYPYFTTAHYLLTQKLMKDDPSEGKKQLSDSSVYFTNSLWIEHMLNDRDNDNVRPRPRQEPAPPKTEEPKEPSPIKAEQEDEFFNDEIVYAKHKDEPPLTIRQTEPSKFQTAGDSRDIAFEPYHTVDYFASQGIKPAQEEKPKDRFAQQLKSFTDWLKVMKRLPESEIVKAVSPQSEENVANMAEHSIESREVVTESMAEVWIKQGHPEKAIEIYDKLSLLNPSKSAYFAHLIEKLKSN